MTHDDDKLTYFSYCDAYDINQRGRIGHFGRMDSICDNHNYNSDQFVHHIILIIIIKLLQLIFNKIILNNYNIFLFEVSVEHLVERIT